MIVIQQTKIGDVKVLKKSVSNFLVTLEVGDQVEIIGIGERGYNLKELTSGTVVLECGWDLFEE